MNTEQIMALADAYAHQLRLSGQGRIAVDARAALEAALTEKQEPWCKAMNRCESKCDDCPDPAPEAKQEPVAWCDLSLDGKHIAFFDGKPVIMVGPVGNDCHRTPLYTHPAPVNQQLLDVVKRIRQWDALDIPDTDGAFWKRELDAAIKQADGKV